MENKENRSKMETNDVCLEMYVNALAKYNGEDYDDVILTKNIIVEVDYARATLYTNLYLSATKMILTDYIYIPEIRYKGFETNVTGIENIAKLLKHFKVDLSDEPYLIDNLFEAIREHGISNAFEEAEDYEPLLNQLGIPFQT